MNHDWRQGSYINQYYKKLSGRSLLEDIEIFMVDNIKIYNEFPLWYDRILILELKFKLLNESKNYRKNLTNNERFRISELIVKKILHIYNNGLRYSDVEDHVSHCIEKHKEHLERYRGYGHYGYINYIW